MGELLRRIHYLLHKRRFDAELQNDMEFHREMATREGRSNFGNVLRLREQSREAWGWVWIDRLLQDLRYAARILWRAPGFTLVAVLMLAIGIGVNVTAFSLFDMVALKPLPVRDPASLVRLTRRSPENIGSEMSYPSVIFYRDHARTLSAVMAVMGVPPMTVERDEQPAPASFATANYFSELGTAAAYGRLFDPKTDDSSSASASVVLSYGFWQRRFGANPAVVGSTIHLNGKPATVIGILPYAFASLGGQTPDIWMPMAQQPYFVEGSKVLTQSATDSVRMWGRLAPGVSAQAAEKELLNLTNELRQQHPKEIWNNEYIHSEPGGHLQVMQPEMYRVAGMVAVLTLLILAVACANLGGLLLARGVTREREIGIRISIGASRRRIFRQLLTESLLLAILGSVAGIALSYAVLKITLQEVNAPKWLNAAPDWRILLGAAGIGLVSVLFFGLAPALQIARERQRKTTVRQVLVGAQIAASCVLLIVAALLVRAAHHVLYSSPGFGYQQVLSVDPGLGRHGYSPASAQSYLDQMQGRLRAVPGVISVSLVKLPPMGHVVARMDTEIDGRIIAIYPNWIEPAYFETMSIPVLAGRNLFPSEKKAVVVSASLAHRQWPGQNPIGKAFGDGKDAVVGVVGDARVNAINDDDAVEAYWAAQQTDMPDMSVIVKTAGAVEGLPVIVKSIDENLDPRIFPEITPLKNLFDENVSVVKQLAMIVSLIGTVAVAMAGIGIVGLVGFTVSQRIKEIAIRLALGAKRAHVLGAVLRQFLWPALLGVLAGAGFAGAASKLLRKALYGINNLDAVSYSAAIGVLTLIVLISALLPARRALRLDLAKTLHYE
jgi:predicted permease